MAQEQKLDELLSKIEKKITKMDPIMPQDMPEVPLYMDQLTTMMDTRLRTTLRHPSEDKVLTKTMINNYAKNDLIPPPHKKRYTKDHIYELLFIFYFKNFLSIGDIQTLLSPLTSDFFGKEKEFGLEDVYSGILSMSRGARGKLQDTVKKVYDDVENAFANAPEDKREYLKKFAFVCELSYDIFLKKYYIEQLIDEISADYVIDHESSFDEEMRKKVAKEATSEAVRVAKLLADQRKAREKARQERLKMDKAIGGDKKVK